MITLELTSAEAAALRETLRHDLSDMSVEIAGTDRKAYRDEIKLERELLQGIVERLDASL